MEFKYDVIVIGAGHAGCEAAAAAAQDRPQPRPVGTEGSCRPPGQCAGGL